MLMPKVHKPSGRSHNLPGQLALEIDVEPVIPGLLKVLRIPKEIDTASPDVRSGGPTYDRHEGVASRIWIRNCLLRYTLKQRSSKLVTRHTEKRRFEEVDSLEAGDRTRRKIKLRRNGKTGVPEAQSRFIIDAQGQASARRERQGGRIPHAWMIVIGPLPHPVPAIKVIAHQLKSLGRHLGRVRLHLGSGLR